MLVAGELNNFRSMLPIDEKRCSLKEIAEWQSYSVKTIRRWVQRGLEVERSSGRAIRTTREAVLRFLGRDSSEAAPQPKPVPRRNRKLREKFYALYGVKVENKEKQKRT